MNLLFSSSYFGFGAMFFGLGWLVLSMVSHIPFGVVTGLGAIITAIGTGVTVHALSKLEKIEVSENWASGIQKISDHQHFCLQETEWYY